MSKPALHLPPGAQARPLSAGRGPRAVALVTGSWAALLLGASLLWPPLTGYDEAMHVGMAGAYAGAPTRLYGPGELTESRALRTLRQQLPADPARTPYDALPLAARGERPSFAALGGLGPEPGGEANQMVQHPPLGYVPYAAVLAVPGVDRLAWDQQVWLLRLVSVLLVLPVPALAWATARRLLPSPGGPDGGPTPRADRWSALAVTAAVLPLSLPNLVRVCASVSNDVPLVLATSVVLLGLARVVTGDLGRRTGLLVGGALAAALLTKGLALVLPPLVVVAYGFALRARARAGAVSLVTGTRRHGDGLLLALAGALVGGLWWVRNLVIFHKVQVDGVGEAGLVALYGPPDGGGGLGRFLLGWPYLVLVRLWGGVGLPDTPLPSGLVLWGWPVVVAVALLAAVVVRTPGPGASRPGARLGVVLVAWAPLALTLLVVAYGSFASYQRWSDAIHGAQGRYVYPLVVGVAAGSAVGAQRLPARLRTHLPVLVLVAALAGSASTWAMILTSWMAPGAASSPSALRAGVVVLQRVSPLPAIVTLVLVLILPVVAGVAAVAGLRSRRDTGDMTTTQTPGRHRVVVIGTGFGGLFAVKALKRADVGITLIGKTTAHLFQPLLYQVATGILSEGEIAPAAREVVRRQDNVTTLVGEVREIDVEARTVTSHHLGRTLVTPYDDLLVSAGAGQSYFGNDHFARYAPGMKDIDDALELRGMILGSFELAEIAALRGDKQEVARLLSFVVVGAGPTGVEMAGQIAELSRRTLKRDFRHIDPRSASITLVDGAKQVLPAFGDRLGELAQRRLEKLGVEVVLGGMVVDIDATGIEVKDVGSGYVRRIEAITKVWAAGVKGSELGATLSAQTGAELDRAGRIAVLPDLTLPGHPEIHVVGDMMSLDGLPGVAQVAIQGARFSAKQIQRRLAGQPTDEAFRYHDKGSMATVSRFSAVASVGRLRFGGFVAWVLWLAVHLVYIIGFKNRITTLLHWAVSFLGRGRAERTITEQQVFGRRAIEQLGASDQQRLPRG